MRRPSVRMLTNSVTLAPTAFARDGAGGRQPIPLPGNQPWRCSVQPTSTKVEPSQMRDANVIYLTVKFYDDPGLRYRDVIVDELGRDLVVIGERGPSGGARRTWEVDCEYHPPPATP